jgi:hypothetical protein
MGIGLVANSGPLETVWDIGNQRAEIAAASILMLRYDGLAL